jgi:hypothetical protein
VVVAAEILDTHTEKEPFGSDAAAGSVGDAGSKNAADKKRF